jgi:hypothetical protein
VSLEGWTVKRLELPLGRDWKTVRMLVFKNQQMLLHAQQTGLTCNWHAMFAITGKARLMFETALKPDEVAQRVYCHRLIERTWWNRAHLEQPCDWEALASTIPASSMGVGYRQYHISYRTGSMLHAVALLMPADQSQPHFISDSLAVQFRAYSSREAFLRSRYARAFLISEILEVMP